MSAMFSPYALLALALTALAIRVAFRFFRTMQGGVAVDDIDDELDFMAKQQPEAAARATDTPAKPELAADVVSPFRH